VTEIVRETGCLDEKPIRHPILNAVRQRGATSDHVQLAGANLGALNRVCQASPVKITLPYPHDLRLALQSAKSCRVDYASAVAFERFANVARPRVFGTPEPLFEE
jgi:hypothetical protein